MDGLPGTLQAPTPLYRDYRKLLIRAVYLIVEGRNGFWHTAGTVSPPSPQVPDRANKLYQGVDLRSGDIGVHLAPHD